MDTVKIDMFLGQSESKGQIEGDIRLPDEKADLEKIYNVTCVVNVREKTVAKDEIAVEGNADFTIYYIDANGKCDCFVAGAPFSHTMEVKGVDSDNDVSVFLSTDGVDAFISDGRTLKLKTDVVFTADVMGKTGVFDIDGGGMETKRIPVDTLSVENREQHSFHLNEEMRVPGGMDGVESVIGTNCYGIINGLKKEGDAVVCFGDICVNTIYSSGDELWQINDSFPFEEAVEWEGELEGRELFGEIAVKKATATAYDPDVISYSVFAVIKVESAKGIPCGMIVDAYSLSHKINTVKNHISTKSLMANDGVKYTFRANCPVGNIQKPVAVMATPYVKNAYAMDGTVNMEGELVCDVLYIKEDGAKDCERVRLPLDETVPAPTVKEGYEVWLTPWVQKASMIITGDDMEIRALMDIGLKAYSQEEFDTVEAIEEREPLKKDKSSVMVYFKDEDEDLFDIAKKYHLSMNDINADRENKLILINPVEE